jgi:hypothetical protein
MRVFSHFTIFVFLCATTFASPSEKDANKLKAVKATAFYKWYATYNNLYG